MNEIYLPINIFLKWYPLFTITSDSIGSCRPGNEMLDILGKHVKMNKFIWFWWMKAMPKDPICALFLISMVLLHWIHKWNSQGYEVYEKVTLLLLFIHLTEHFPNTFMAKLRAMAEKITEMGGSQFFFCFPQCSCLPVPWTLVPCFLLWIPFLAY